jgi:hypothetical protein
MLCPLSVADVLGQENLIIPSPECDTHHDTARMVLCKGKVLVGGFRLDATL